jgi:CubicO group peptidase (beta-lactamase class C family)
VRIWREPSGGEAHQHTPGFGDDVFTDTGYGDDCVEKYVTSLTGQDQFFPPGEYYSYNNAGFVVLGRIIEVLRGKSFDQCLKEHLIGPLKLTHGATGPYEAILHRAAVGHVRLDEEHVPEPASVWALQRSTSPAGSMFAMSASDLMVFAKMHFDGGSAPDGGRLLGEQATHAMQETQVTLPCIGTCDQAWGLGWAIYNLDGGGQVFGRDGATIGQGAFSRMAPERNLAIAVRANGGNMGNVGQEIYARVLRDLAGLETPPEAVPDPAATMPDTSRFAGKYSSEAEDNVVRVDEDGRVFIDSAPGASVRNSADSRRPWTSGAHVTCTTAGSPGG